MDEERLRFGTAGLRGPLGEGPMCMNVELVHIAATAIARWLPAASTVIIGRDHRHDSEDFANVTASVLAEFGHTPGVFAGTVPTPVVAHTIRASNAAAGVMVTASHNPATDNGYKVYVADGGQLLPDDAVEIEALMAAQTWPGAVGMSVPVEVELLGESETSRYVASALDLSGEERGSPLVVAYTAMHGVGGSLFAQVLEAAGYELHCVAEQHQPDPAFPTAAFPNPEEPGTLDLVMALADDVDADIVLANDPDADRLAVGVKRDDGWERLTGDQIGVLLGWSVLESADGPCTVATTIVSSTLLAKLATSRGVTAATTLTGFKYLARAGTPEAPLVFAYEEALGYAVDPQVVHDKDGITAGLAFAALASRLKADGRSVDDLLGEIYDEFGTHLTAQVTHRFETERPMDDMSALMAHLRSRPSAHVGEIAVSSIEDLIDGSDTLPPSDVLIYHLDGGRVIVRPSGTEPKIKAYLEVIDHDSDAARQRLDLLRTAVARLLAQFEI